MDEFHPNMELPPDTILLVPAIPKVVDIVRVIQLTRKCRVRVYLPQNQISADAINFACAAARQIDAKIINLARAVLELIGQEPKTGAEKLQVLENELIGAISLGIAATGTENSGRVKPAVKVVQQCLGSVGETAFSA